MIKILGRLAGRFTIRSMMVGCRNETNQSQQITTTTENEPIVSIKTEKKEVGEKEIYNENGIIIIYKNTKKDEYGDINVNFRIENNTNDKIRIEDKDTSVDGIMIDSLTSYEIMPGKMIDLSMYFFSFELEENDIDSFIKLETKLRVIDINGVKEIPIELDVEVEQCSLVIVTI